MAGSMFTASPVHLTKLLGDAQSGALQLPDFQRSWVWDEERIRSLIASISRGFPVGAVMTLETGGDVNFRPRPVEGAPDAAKVAKPDSLLLDGQQRLTSLFQVLLRGEVVETVTPRNQRVRRWFYIDMDKALDPTADRDDAIVIVPESKQVKSDFGRVVELDVTSVENEVRAEMFPVASLLGWADWQQAYLTAHIDDVGPALARMERFRIEVIQQFTNYLVPVIELGKTTSKEAVCVVFEKVNTGGKSLDAFELITAMYAADGHELRRDWYGAEGHEGRQERLRQTLRMPSASAGVLSGVGNTDFLQIVALFHTRDVRDAAAESGKSGRELPQVSLKRQTLLNLPLTAYLQYQDHAERGLVAAAKFLIGLGIFRVYDLPYQSQVVPLAAILAELGDRVEIASVAAKVARWFWNGVFGELYGSSTETRMARDFTEVLAWIDGGDEPTTVRDAFFREDRLRSLRSRQSAAYKGVNALLMQQGAHDFRTGQAFTNTVFFDENVDIHHIFPQHWCRSQGIARDTYDSIVNKTPLTARTNRIIGGGAPSQYLAELERSDSESSVDALDSRLRSHLIDVEALRSDDFDAFINKRRAQLAHLIAAATGKAVIETGGAGDEEVFVDSETDDAEQIVSDPH
ncbi:DUF262 domain-containing protein [Microbacterium sp. NPDC077644]|uniref:GmrSD restriction endonuclease domain-containing protein n=1 Tax=Microbacterium sp. NPDC077644 TaxID=3155055 RepID=UPI00344D7A22